MAKKNTSEAPEPIDPTTAPAEGYTVLARRYRPLTFVDLVGQEPVTRALGNALKSNRVAHAYLFTGARGVGKTSTARILAKALNCVNGPTPNPCGVCEICKGIASGEDVDVLEIDGASNRKIDEIRDIRNNVQYRPARSRYKIYIIDEVHMLTREAFNALLKTLEEPPAHVKFIFATTEVDKVPITILSRCQRFDFAGISLPRIVERLKSIVESEGLKADVEALELIARRAGGSMRDAQSLLDQLLAFGGDRLTSDQVHHLLGTAGDERILGLAEAILTNDAKQALDLLDEASVGGLQLGELVDQMIAYWRDLMVAHCAGTEGRDLSVPSRHHDTLRKQAKSISLDAILAGLDVLSATKGRMRGSNHGRTLVEMAVVRLGRLADLASVAQLAQWIGQVRLDPRAALPTPTAPRLAGPATEGVKKKPLTTATEPTQETGQPVSRELTPANWPALWPEIVSILGALLGSELAKAGAPAITGPNSLVFRFAARYTQAKETVAQSDRLARVEDALRRVTDKPWTVRFELDHSTGPLLLPEEAVAPSKPKVAPKEEAEKVPLVKRSLDLLGATIQRVDEGFAQEPSEER